MIQGRIALGYVLPLKYQIVFVIKSACQLTKGKLVSVYIDKLIIMLAIYISNLSASLRKISIQNLKQDGLKILEVILYFMAIFMILSF